MKSYNQQTNESSTLKTDQPKVQTGFIDLYNKSGLINDAKQPSRRRATEKVPSKNRESRGLGATNSQKTVGKEAVVEKNASHQNLPKLKQEFLEGYLIENIPSDTKSKQEKIQTNKFVQPAKATMFQAPNKSGIFHLQKSQINFSKKENQTSDYEDIALTQRSQQSRPLTPNSINIKMQRQNEKKTNQVVSTFDYHNQKTPKRNSPVRSNRQVINQLIYSPNDSNPFERKEATPTPILRQYNSKENSVLSPQDSKSPLLRSANNKFGNLGIPLKHEATKVLSKSSKINQIQKTSSNLNVDMASRNSPVRKIGPQQQNQSQIPDKYKQISFLGNHVNQNGRESHLASKTTENMSIQEQQPHFQKVRESKSNQRRMKMNQKQLIAENVEQFSIISPRRVRPSNQIQNHFNNINELDEEQLIKASQANQKAQKRKNSPINPFISKFKSAFLNTPATQNPENQTPQPSISNKISNTTTVQHSRNSLPNNEYVMVQKTNTINSRSHSHNRPSPNKVQRQDRKLISKNDSYYQGIVPSMTANMDNNIMLFKQSSGNANQFKYSGQQSQLSVHEQYFVNERLGATKTKPFNTKPDIKISEMDKSLKAKSQIIRVNKTQSSENVLGATGNNGMVNQQQQSKLESKKEKDEQIVNSDDSSNRRYEIDDNDSYQSGENYINTLQSQTQNKNLSKKIENLEEYLKNQFLQKEKIKKLNQQNQQKIQKIHVNNFLSQQQLMKNQSDSVELMSPGRNQNNGLTSPVVKENKENEEKEDKEAENDAGRQTFFQKIKTWDIFGRGSVNITNVEGSQLESTENEKVSEPEPVKKTEEEIKEEIDEINERIICDCDKNYNYKFGCKQAVTWFLSSEMINKIRKIQKTNAKADVFKIINTEYDKCKASYKQLRKLEPKNESSLQIERDLNRTFPKNSFFKQHTRGYRKLRKVLRAFSCYDNQADYVQGMNFLVGQLLMHCSDTLTFWLFVELIEEYELRDIYQVGLPGLQKHSYIIKMLVSKHLPTLGEHFEEHCVQAEMYASDWIFSLFSSVLPENQTKVTASFFNQFFKYKWEFFYKLVLTILEHIQDKLLEAEDMFSVLQQIKIAMSNKNDPYNYAQAYAQSQLQGQQNNLVDQDSDLESILGSVQHAKEGTMKSVDGQESNDQQAQTSLVDKFANMFRFKSDAGAPKDKNIEEWEEFPWEKIMVEQDIIKKWKDVDMKTVNQLHANFDTETAKFTNLEVVNN